MKSDIDIDKIINDLKKEFPIDEEMKFCEFDIQENLKDNTFLLVKYRDHYDKENAHLAYLNELIDKLIGERYDFYRFSYEKTLDKTEIRQYYIPRDTKVVKMKKIIRKQKIRVDFFEMCVLAVKQQGWGMKNFVDTLRQGL